MSQTQPLGHLPREKGLAGLANNVALSDKGTSRKLEDAAIQLIEGLALQKPPRSMAAIHRQVTIIAEEQGWKPPSYDRVRHIIKGLDPALVTFAHQGAAAYREEAATQLKCSFSGEVPIDLQQFLESSVPLVECPDCTSTSALSPHKEILYFKSHKRRKTRSTSTEPRWVRRETIWAMMNE